MGTPQGRRGNTRERIQDVALELFAEHGYEKTSLREIAEQLDVTKAALYYHFRTKEDIVLSFFTDLAGRCDELIEWAERQPRTLETKQEVIRRYSAVLRQASPVFRFIQENQATVRELTVGQSFKDRLLRLYGLLIEPDTATADRVRCMTALFSLHSGTFAMEQIEGDPEEKRAALVEVATDLVTAAHRPRPAPTD